MKTSFEQLARKLEAAFGADAVEAEPHKIALRAVDGKRPEINCAPNSPQEIVAALRLCSEAQATVSPWGGGSAMSVGNPPRRVDVVIETTRLNRVIEHDHANLTATVQSGVRVAALQEILGRQNQFLPVDPPQPARATGGGVVAANLNGPRRSYYGGVRDLVIGMKVALASGELIKAGGKVVKNVAGYDMCKLFVGSLGTLGIITEVTLRMAPIPERAATVIAAGTLPAVFQLADAIARSPLLPAAVFILNGPAMEASDRAPAAWRVAIWSEGFEETVGRSLRDTTSMAESLGLDTQILRDASHGRLWRTIGDFPLSPDRLVCRATLPRASLNPTIDRFGAGAPSGLHAAMIADVTMGNLWISLAPEAAGLKAAEDLMTVSKAARGHAVILSAPPGLKEGFDVWGPLPQTIALMRRVKEQFDPQALLNPGRFVAGLEIGKKAFSTQSSAFSI